MGRSTIGASVGAAAVAAALGLTVWSTVPAGAATGTARATGATPATAAPTKAASPIKAAAPTKGAARGASGGATGPAGIPATVTRTWLEHALARRQATLSRLTTLVGKTPALSATARRTLQSQLAAETSGINGLAAAAPGEGTATLGTTAGTMVNQYRVYAVMVPKVHIAVSAGRQQRAEQRAATREQAISARISRAQHAGHTVTQAQSAYQNLVKEVSAATSSTAGASSVLTVEPSGYPADAGAIRSARAALTSARSVLPSVRTDLRTIRTTLRGA